MEENKGFKQLEDGTTLYDILGEEFEVTEQLDRSFQLERIYPREISEYRALGKKEYSRLNSIIKMGKNLDVVLEGWRLPKTYIMILIAVLVITIFINPLITLLGALVFAAAILMSKKKCKEFEQVFRIEGNHIVRR